MLFACSRRYSNVLRGTTRSQQISIPLRKLIIKESLGSFYMPLDTHLAIAAI
jgi:hypothetical protein